MGAGTILSIDAGTSLGDLVGVERDPHGAVVAVFVDSPGSMAELRWTPGAALGLRTVALSQPALAWSPGASLSATHILRSSLGNKPHLIDRQSGLVTVLDGLGSALAVLTPDGRSVVSVTDHGLLRHALGCIGEGEMHLSGTRPMHVMNLDSPHSVALLPGAGSAGFTVAIGCYGALALVTVTDFAAQPTPHAGRLIHTDKLPYDPVHVILPVKDTGGSGRIFVTDEGRAGLMALSLVPGLADRCPLDDRNYSAVRHVVPRLDGRECLVLGRDDRWVRWLPGAQVVRPASDLGGWPLLWDGAVMLVLDRDRGEIRETMLA